MIGPETGNLQACLSSALGHVCPTKFDPRPKPYGHHRLRHIEHSLLAAVKQLRKVAEVAESTGCTPVLDVLKEEFPFGVAFSSERDGQP